MTDEVRVARAALHMWEEPCISGKEGSGAVFFVGCPLHCVFCQNREIAAGRGGRAVTVPELAEIFLRLEKENANNINLVTPTHFVPAVIEAAARARENGLRIPIVYNTGSYETVKTVELLAGTVDIFLPDLKFYDPEIARRYADAPDYFEAAAAAIGKMAELTGPPVFDGRGIMQRGTLVRHMVMPSHTKDSMRILDYLADTYGKDLYVSIMSQYTPMPGIEKRFPELGRRVTRREYEKVVDHALALGLTNAYIQERETAKESFIPAFDGTGV